MKRLLTYLCIVAGIAIASIVINSCSDNTSDPTGNTFTGTLEYEDGSPAKNALVVAGNLDFETIYYTDSTDENGEFEIREIPDDISKVFIKTEIEGNIHIHGSLDDLKGESEDQKIKIKILNDDSCCAKISVVVKSGDDIIKEAEVRLNRGDDIIKKKFTDEEGKAVFTNICEGEFWIRIAKTGYNVVEKEFKLDSCAEENFTINLTKKEDDDCCGKLKFKLWNKEKTEEINDASVKLMLGDDIIKISETDQNGNIVFEDLCEGKYWVRIAKEGYKVIETHVELDSCETKEEEFLLETKSGEECCGKLKIKVVDENGEALKDSEVKLALGNDVIAKKSTDANGIVEFIDLCLNKNYFYRIHHVGYKVIENDIKLESCEEWKVLEITLKSDNEECCEGILKVFPKDKLTGLIVAGVKVKLWKNGKLVAESKTEANGVVFDGLCEGEYGISFNHELFVNAETDFYLNCNETKELIKELIKVSGEECCDGNIYVIPKSKDGGWVIDGATVKLWKNGELIETATVENGKAEFTNLCEGKYGIDIMHEEYKNIEFNVELGCNETKEIVKELSATGEECCDGNIYVIPKSKGGGWVIEGATVKLWKNGELIETATVENGKAEFTNLCEGKYGIDIMHEEYKNIEFNVELGCNETKEIVKELSATGEECCDNRIKVNVRDAGSNELITDAKIQLWKNGDKIKVISSESEWNVIEEICKGSYVLVILHENYLGIEWEVSVDCDEILTFEKKLESK